MNPEKQGHVPKMVKIDPVYIGLTRDYIFMEDNEHYRMIYSHIGGETSFFNRAFVSGYGDEAPSNSECDHNGYTQQFDALLPEASTLTRRPKVVRVNKTF